MIEQWITSLYCGRPVALQPNQAEKMLKEINIFYISSQIYDLLQKADGLTGLPEEFCGLLKKEYEETAYLNLLIKHELENLLHFFDERHIDVIVLKGIPFSEKVFGHFAARRTIDIDLLVHPCDMQRAISCIKDNGFVSREQDDDRYNNNHGSFDKAFAHFPFRLTTELHWNLDREYMTNVHEGPLWDEAEKYRGYKHVKQLSIQHMFYHICLHGARHGMRSLKFFIDIIQMLVAFPEEIDFPALLKQARNDQTSRRVRIVLATVYKQFPFLHDVKPLDIKSCFVIWNFPALKEAKEGKKTWRYYLFRIYHRWFIYDTFSQFLLSSQWIQVIFPPKNHLRYRMNIEDRKDYSMMKLYVLLYKKRWKRLMQR